MSKEQNKICPKNGFDTIYLEIFATTPIPIPILYCIVLQYKMSESTNAMYRSLTENALNTRGNDKTGPVEIDELVKAFNNLYPDNELDEQTLITILLEARRITELT